MNGLVGKSGMVSLLHDVYSFPGSGDASNPWNKSIGHRRAVRVRAFYGTLDALEDGYATFTAHVLHVLADDLDYAPSKMLVPIAVNGWPIVVELAEVRAFVEDRL